MIFGRPPRAYALIDGRWNYVYTSYFYTQVSLLGDNVKMATCYIGKKGKVPHEIPIEQLFNKKPQQRAKQKSEA